MSFQLNWNPVRSTISPELTRRQSYGGAIQQVSDTLNTLANQTRQANTQESLLDIASKQNLGALQNNQDLIMNTVGDIGNNTIDRGAILGAFNAQKQKLTEQQLNNDKLLGQQTADALALSGANQDAIIQTALKMSPNSLGPLAELFKNNQATAYEHGQDSIKNRQEDTRLGISATTAGYQGAKILADLTELIATHPDLTTTENYVDDNNVMRTRTTVVPGVAKILQASGFGGALDQFLGMGGGVGGKSNLPIGSSTGTGSAKVTLEPHHGEVINSARSFGFSDNVTAGLLGNLQVEGGYKGAKGDGGNSHGIVQWNGTRLDNFKRVIGKSPSESSVTEQMNFVKWELDNYEKSGALVYNKADKLSPKQQYERIMNASSPEQAAEYIDKYYERSSGEHRQKRVNYATSFAGALGGGNGVVNPTYTNNTIHADSKGGAINSALGSTTTDAPSGSAGYKIDHALLREAQSKVGGYEAQQEKNRNYTLNSKNQATRTIEFNAFKDKEGFSSGGDFENLLKYVNNVPEYMALSSDDKQVALKQLKADKSAKGYDSARSSMTKIVANMRSSEVSKARTGAIDQFVKESEAFYKSVKKDNPSLTLDKAMQMISVDKYNEWKKRTSAPKSNAKPKANTASKGKGIPYMTDKQKREEYLKKEASRIRPDMSHNPFY